MKNGMILGLLVSLSLAGTVSAMTMTDDTMMKKDSTMMSDSMDKSMMKDTMMKEDKMMMKKSTAALAGSMGYTWSRDRKTLAMKAGVVGYRGTAKQNMVIRTYLMSMMNDKMMKDDTMMGDAMKK